MTKKPDRTTAMQLIIEQVKAEFPLYDIETTVCGPNGACEGCPKKLLELVDSELTYWESAMRRKVIPNFDDISRFGKLCRNVRRGLVRNNILPKR